MTKHEIAEVLGEIGTLLELKGENPFKVRAYQAGARAIEAIEPAELERLLAAHELESVKGIGQALAAKIGELHATGRLGFLEELRASVAPGLVEMLEVPGLGPKKIKALHDRLGVASLAALEAACRGGKVAALDGFGEKTQANLLAGIERRVAYGKRHLWWDAWEVAEPLLAGLRALPQVARAEAAGSLRRGLETVGDLDFIVAGGPVEPIVEWFVARPGIEAVTAQGGTKASVRFASGLQADLRIVPAEQFAFALHHFTGSKDHNVQMRQRALARGLSLSEWGLAPSGGEETVKVKLGIRSGDASTPPRAGQGAADGATGPSPAGNGPPRPPAAAAVIRAESERELFAALGLQEIPPELREGRGEIEAAERGEIPRLVEATDLRGVFHNHTTASDGKATLAEMAGAAAALGWEYLGIADHSKSSRQARGLEADRLLRQVEEIRALNDSGQFPLRVFTGVECDILPDGELDFDADLLARLDYVVASVHSAFTQDEATMTRRIIRAVEHPATTMLGHPTGRLLLQREAYAVDLAQVIDAAIAHGVVIELNASKYRLDLDWRHWRKAAERGLLCSINPDAHDAAGLDQVRTGVNAARKGWITRESVLNTRPLADVERWLRNRKVGRSGSPG
jgi:DNA polymerase (family 10)